MTVSVFVVPFFAALLSALLAACFKLLQEWDYITLGRELDVEGRAFAGFTVIVGILLVFRVSQAYGRFWSGCAAAHQMRAEWVDAASLIMSFIRVSRGGRERLAEFQGTLVRLFSLLHAVALAELEEINRDSARPEDVLGFKYKVIDPDGLDELTLRQIKLCDSKVELLHSWIQMLITENIDAGVLSLAPPLQTRVFTSLSNGMLSFFGAAKIAVCPFPFPYYLTCNVLLIIHWCAAPLVMTQWVSNAYLAAAFVFIQVFALWALNRAACEIQNPFGKATSDLDGDGMQEEINHHLLLLVRASEVRSLPRLSASATRLYGMWTCEKTLLDIWGGLAGDGEPVPEPARKLQVRRRRRSVQPSEGSQHARQLGLLGSTAPGKPGSNWGAKSKAAVASAGGQEASKKPLDQVLEHGEDSYEVGRCADQHLRSAEPMAHDWLERPSFTTKMFSEDPTPTQLLVPMPMEGWFSAEDATSCGGPSPRESLGVQSPREPHLMPPLQPDWPEYPALQSQLHSQLESQMKGQAQSPMHVAPSASRAVLRPMGDRI